MCQRGYAEELVLSSRNLSPLRAVRGTTVNCRGPMLRPECAQPCFAGLSATQPRPCTDLVGFPFFSQVCRAFSSSPALPLHPEQSLTPRPSLRSEYNGAPLPGPGPMTLILLPSEVSFSCPSLANNLLLFHRAPWAGTPPPRQA